MFNEQIDQEANRFWDKTCLPRNFVTDAEHQSPWSCFSTRYTQNNIVLYVFDDHVVFEGQVSSQRSTRTRSVASFYYCTYLASLEWAIFKTFLKIYGSKYTHQLVLFKGFFQMCLHAPYRKIRISAEVLCSRGKPGRKSSSPTNPSKGATTWQHVSMVLSAVWAYQPGSA